MILDLQIEFQYSDVKHALMPGSWRTFSVFLIPLSFPNMYSRHPNAIYTGGILTVYSFQISTVGPSSLGFVLSTSNAIYTGGFPHSMSFSNLYSRHPMLLPDTKVQVICLHRQSDPLNCLPYSVFWLPCTIYMLGCFLAACPCPWKTPFGPPSCQTIFLSQQPNCFQIAHLNWSSNYFVLYPQ